jgi:DNA-binding NtrC family response regulator
VPVKVLIVDDEVDFLDIMAERMRARGIDVSTATSAEDALNLVGQEHYDVIIMDFMMPAMNGFKALKLLKAKKADTPIILMTGSVPGELILQAKQNGALDVFEKPADLQTLIEKIKQVTIKKTTRKPTWTR